MKRLALLAGAVGAAAALAAPSGAAPTGGPALAIGRTGGNIAPWSIRVAADGSLMTAGAVTPSATLTPAAVRALVGTATAAGFFSLPREIRCPRVLPDLASRYVTVSSGTRSRTVREHGTCSARFERVYAAVAGALGVE